MLRSLGMRSAGLVTLALVAAAFGLPRAGPAESRTSGPLRTNAPDLVKSSVPIRKALSYGMAIVYNRSTSMMTLRSVHLADETPD